MALRQTVKDEQVTRVGCRVVEAGHEPAVPRDLDAAPGEPLAHAAIVEDRRGDPRIGLAGMAAAGTAIKAGSLASIASNV